MCDIGTSNKCKSCSNEIGRCGTCNDGFELNGGMCYIKDFDIEAEYVTLRENELVELMNCVSEFLEVDGINYSGYPSTYFYMEKPGVHKVKMKLSPYCSFPSLFNNNPFLKSIKFYDHFDSKRITLMNDCFCDCPNLESVDLSNLDLSNNHCFMNFFKNDKKLKEVHFPKSEVYPHYIYGMFQNCESLTSIDISSIHNDYVSYNMHNMFQGCSNLMNINIKSFHSIGYGLDMLKGLPENGRIYIDKKIISVIEEELPINWVVEGNGKKTVFIAGDSTAKSSSSNEIKGWGEYLSQYVSAVIENKAFLGQTPRTFYRDGRWNDLVKKITKGDYVFIQFGHFEEGDAETNSKCSVDGSGDETITISLDGVEEIVHTFPWYIKYFANQALKKEGIPVLLSPTPEFSFIDGKISKTNKYKEYMKAISDELKILYIDHYSYIANNMESLGEYNIKDNKWFPIDNVHTSPEAAESFAKILINGIKCLNNEDLISILNEEEKNANYPCLNKE